MNQPFILTWAFLGFLWSPAVLALSDSEPDTAEPETAVSAEASPNTGEPPSPSAPSPATPVPVSAPPTEPSAHVGGMVGAAVGAGVPLAIAGAFGSIVLFYTVPDGVFIGNESLLKFNIAPVATVVALSVVPFTAGLGTLIGLSTELGVERSLLPALAAGVAAPVGALAGAVAVGVIGVVLGGLAAPVILELYGSGTFYDLGLLIGVPVVGGAIGLGVGAAGGAIAGPTLVAHEGDRLVPQLTAVTEAE